jgi:hypothetical protein
MNTQIADVIVPEIFNKYVQERTAELSAIRNSGIVAPIPGLAVPQGGVTVKFWNDITGDDEVLSDSTALTPAKITADKDVAVVLARGKAWSANDLAEAFSGDDPMRAIADLVATYRARKEQAALLAILGGAFASASMTDNVLDISGESGNAAIITAESLVDAISLLGDVGSMLTGIVTHSAVLYDLAKKRILDPKLSEPGSAQAPEFQSYLGRQIIADDGAPQGSGVYTTYIFGSGAVGYAEGTPPVPTETERNALAGNDILVHRWHYIMHPRGVAWTGTASGATPSNTELGTGANWNRVYDNKNVRIVAFKHKIGPLT